jgi:DNA-binding transcriptional ArsR family regulator
MPAPTTDLIQKASQLTITVAVEPAYHFIQSLVLLHKREHLSGYAEWITQTAVSLTPEQHRTNTLVIIGLHYAVLPFRSWSSVEAYLANLAAHHPETLRDRVLDAYASLTCNREEPVTDRAQILSSPEAYLEYLYGRFPDVPIDEEIEREAYALMIDPPRLQQVIVNHLRQMWETIYKPEWERVQPMLQASADAFNQLDLAGMTPTEAAGTILGKDVREQMDEMLTREKLENIIFVPSAHIGPYISKFVTSSTLWVLFGARLPEGTAVVYPDLSRSELLVRLNALADDNRLRIIQLIRDEGEQCSQDVINLLGLSQSAASRHLKQLSATGYLIERRREGAKCYSLNQERIEATLQALAHFLGPS